MNLSDYRTRLTDFYGAALGDNTDFYNRVINDSYLELAAYADWWWLEKTQIIKFPAPMTAKDLIGDTDSTALTYLSDFDVTTAYCFGWVTTGENTYRIRSVTTTYALIDSPFIETTGTYACYVWNDIASLASDVDTVVYMVNRNDPGKRCLPQVDMENIVAQGADMSGLEEEVANRFAVFREPAYASTTFQIRVFPPPEEIAEYEVQYKQAVTTMANDTASAIIPTKHEMCLVNFALLKLAKFTREDQDVISMWNDEFTKSLTRLLQDQANRGRVVKRAGLREPVIYGSLPYRITDTTVGGV